MLTLGRLSNADPNILIGYTDTSWACDPDDYSSTSGYVFKLGDTTISWNSKKQSTIASSSTEAEYMAMSHCTKQALWLHYLLTDIGHFDNPAPTTRIFTDNTGAIALAKKPRFHSCTQHIGAQYHSAHKQVKKGVITFIHMPTTEMLAVTRVNRLTLRSRYLL